MSGWSAEQQAWGWLAIAVIAGLALLYLIRPRRRQVEVPFGGLWRHVLQQSEATALGRRWQRLWSFLVLAALAGLLLAALAEVAFRPEAQRAPPKRSATVIALDRSASMATRDGPPLHPGQGPSTRFERARRAVEALVRESPPDEELLLIAASGQAQVVSGWGADRPALLAALQQLEPSQAGLDWARAVELAQQSLAGRPQPRLVWVSDGGPGLAGDVTPSVALQELRIAADPSPVGIDNLAVEQVSLRPLAHDPERGVLTVRLRNDSRAPLAARLVVTASQDARSLGDLRRDQALQRLVDVDVPAGVSQHRVEDLQLALPRLAVRVEGRAPGWQDRAPWDDVGLAVLAQVKKLRVLVVGRPNLYLEAALAASGRAEVQRLAPEDYRPAEWRGQERARHQIDAVVLDQAGLPPPEGTPSWSLELAPPADTTEVSQRLQGPELLVRAGEHPAMRNVSFQDTNFDAVRLLTPQPGEQVLVAATLGGGRSAAVMVAREAPVRALRCGIDLLETDLTARYAWPILTANVLAWLAGQEEPLVPGLELGRPWAVAAPSRSDGWTYFEPGAPPRPARTAGAALLGYSEVHGVHLWRDRQGREVVRPSLLPASEQPALTTPPRPAYAPRAAEGPAIAAASPWPRWSWWLVAALALLPLEWWLYLRRRLA